jgi:hypothetical protein
MPDQDFGLLPDTGREIDAADVQPCGYRSLYVLAKLSVQRPSGWIDGVIGRNSNAK